MLYLDQQGVAKQREYNILLYISGIYKMCSSRKYSYPHHGGQFCIGPHPLECPFQGVLVILPPPLYHHLNFL